MEVTLESLLKQDLKDEVIVFQTDTVYGIGAKLESFKGIKRIYDIKNREAKKPLAVLCANLEQVKSLVKDYDAFKDLAKTYWPGALTIITDKNDNVPDFVTRGSLKVGVRIPNDPVAQKILTTFGPMAVTSLNISSEPAILKYEEALAFKDDVDYLVKGPDLNALSSTVFDVENKLILRQGDIRIKNT